LFFKHDIIIYFVYCIEIYVTVPPRNPPTHPPTPAHLAATYGPKNDPVNPKREAPTIVPTVMPSGYTLLPSRSAHSVKKQIKTKPFLSEVLCDSQNTEYESYDPVECDVK
jgi:hypothetical protein